MAWTGQCLPIRIAIRYATLAAHSNNRPLRANVRRSRNAAAFGVGGLTPPHNERAKREVIPATLCTRNTHQALLKPAHPYKHTNHMTSYNPARKLASLLTKNDANLHAGYSRIRVMRAEIGSIKRGHGMDALAQRGEIRYASPAILTPATRARQCRLASSRRSLRRRRAHAAA